MIRVFSKNRRQYASAHFVGQLRWTAIALTGAVETIARPGWLYANGAVVSQATYSKLFARIGTTFNTGGEGAGNFRLPDYRGRLASCALDGQVAGGNRMAAVAGTVAGEETHALTLGETPRHVHNGSGLSINGGNHAHSSSALAVSGNNNTGTTAGTVTCAWQSGQTAFSGFAGGSSANAQHTHPSGEIAGASGDGTADSLAGTGHSNVPPVVGCCRMVAYQ